MNIAPVEYQWDGEVMRPMRHYLPRCHKQYVVGETYPLIPHEDRSTNSHNHFFAAVHEAWKNLPERLTPRFPTSEHLRKWALIKSGYADERSIACATADEALKIAAFIKPMDDFAVVVVADATIKVFTAKSQSARAMGKEDFQGSKQAVLDTVAHLIGVDVATLAANVPNSSRDPAPPSPEPETKPAPEQVTASGAGATSSPDGAPNAPSPGEPKQAGGGGDPAANNSAGLPEDWPAQYAAALGVAQTIGSLTRYAAGFWKKFGGWDCVKATEHREKAEKVYDVFKEHFGPAKAEARNAALKELGAA
jgi:hypothetical protein